MKKIPLLLYTYLLTEMLAPFFAALLVLNAILFLGRLVPLLDSIFGLGIGLADFTRIAAYITPALLRFTLPMAAMMAVVIAFTRMRGDLEIMALKAAGIGLARMLPPVLLFGIVTALLTLATSTILVPKGTTAMNQLLLHLAKEKIERGVREKSFSEGLGEVVLYVEEVSPEDRSWRGVYLSDLRDAANPLTVIAVGGRLQADKSSGLATLELTDGSLHLAQEGKTQTIAFARYSLEIPLQYPTMGHPSRGNMTQQELLARAERLGPEHRYYPTVMIEYHQRLALPVGCFLFSVLGLSLSQVGQGSRVALGVPLGLATFVGYYVLLTAAKSLAENGQLPVAAAIWLPNLIFMILALYLLRRSALELGHPWLERLLELIQTKVQRLRHWRRAGKAEQEGGDR